MEDILAAIRKCFGKNPIIMDGGVILVKAANYNALVDCINSKQMTRVTLTLSVDHPDCAACYTHNKEWEDATVVHD